MKKSKKSKGSKGGKGGKNTNKCVVPTINANKTVTIDFRGGSDNTKEELNQILCFSSGDIYAVEVVSQSLIKKVSSECNF